MGFAYLGREILYRGRVFNLERVQIRLPDDRHVFYELVSHPGAVTLIPVDHAGNILFVRQFRVAVQQELLELPAGTLEADEEPAQCAARELREETGMAAEKIEKIGEIFLVPGYSSEYMHFFLATGLRPDPLRGDADEFIKVEKIHYTQAYDMVTQGAIRDGKTLAGLLLLKKYL
ncbi:MAG: NUDIX hydrolase [Anaerolineae bacterium]|nr:NUDIX hydrolase [Anaerolineae bacterium]